MHEQVESGGRNEGKGSKREPKGWQKGAQGSQERGKKEPKEPKRVSKGYQMELKGAEREPKGDQNASTNRPSEKVAKMMAKGRRKGQRV